jgi:ribose 5-phosphate isomerase A
MDQTTKKRNVAAAALGYLRDGMALGVGTGSTVNLFIDGLAKAQLRLDTVVSSSDASTKRLAAAGIPVSDLNDVNGLDLYVDGADEADPNLSLIKGGGGALTREKIIAAASEQFLCIVDDSKLVSVLGAFPLPIEVVPMARTHVARQLTRLGGRPVWRERFVTDNGNQVLDVHGLRIDEPVEFERQLNQIAGVVTVGLFAGRGADVLLVAGDKGVRVHHRKIADS